MRHVNARYLLTYRNVFMYLMFVECVVKDNLYWSDWEARSILQVDKLRATEDGYGVKNAVVHLYSPMDVQVYHELKQPLAESESDIKNFYRALVCWRAILI